MICTLYRAVTPWEYDDVLSHKGFRSVYIPEKRIASLEDKQFAKSLDCGHYYGREIVNRYDNVLYILLKIQLNVKKYCEMVLGLDDCDGISIDRDEVPLFNQCIVSIKKID